MSQVNSQTEDSAQLERAWDDDTFPEDAPRPSVVRPLSGARGRWWLYWLVTLPLLTDLLETGDWPGTPRSWLTELVVGFAIAMLVRRLLKTHARLLELAGTDSLTGLLNRRRFFESLQDESVRARRLRSPLSLIWIDLDDFKQINDHHGHAAGDHVLQHFAAAIHGVIRDRVDRACRMGGDEFVILLPGIAGESAERVLARIRGSCENEGTDPQEPSVRFSASIVQLDATESVDCFLRRADDAMYRTKRHKKEARAGHWQKRIDDESVVNVSDVERYQ